MANAQLTVSLASRGVRSSVVRLPPTVHGNGDSGFMHMLGRIARDKGVSGFVGDGSSRWPAVHRDDAAQLFLSAPESAPAGATLHAVAEEGVPTREIAGAIGRRLALPIGSVAPEEAADHFGWLGGLLALDSPASSLLTCELMGWQPVSPGLVEDLELGGYFGLLE